MGNWFGIQLQYFPRRTSFGMVLSCKDAHEISVGWAWKGDWVKPGLFKKRRPRFLKTLWSGTSPNRHPEW